MPNETKSYSLVERRQRNNLHKIKKINSNNFQNHNKWEFFYDEQRICKLKKLRCLGTTKNNNTRCKRSSVLTIPYCWQHLKSVCKLKISRTFLRDQNNHRFDFLGLFVCEQTSIQSVKITLLLKHPKTTLIYILF
jgi:hypothetical protein